MSEGDDALSAAEVFGAPEEILNELRAVCASLKELILGEHPQALLGYLWSMMFAVLLSKSDESGELPPVSADETGIISAMEYVHAVFAGSSAKIVEFSQVDDEIGERIIHTAEKVRFEAMRYSIALSIAEERDRDPLSDGLDQAIRSNWVSVRGKRFQVLEEEFFEFVLAPHDEALQAIYEVGSREIARGIQSIAHGSRTGFSEYSEEMRDFHERHVHKADDEGLALDAYLERLQESEPEEIKSYNDLILDMFMGGLFDISKKNVLPEKLLDDLSYEVGEDTDFFDGSEFSGTPFQTLPARIKPFIKINGTHYYTEPNFVRDASYRALQRAIISRNPDYRERWNKRQKQLSESAFAKLFEEHLAGAKIYQDVYYPLEDGNWAECDCVMIIDDTLIVLEAKAGTESLLSVSTNLERHRAVVERLVISAHRQCSRFLEYCDSEREVELFEKTDDGYRNIEHIRLSSFRRVYPIGLTVESFSPFSALSKLHEEITPILDKHHFFALSIDDLFVIRRILTTLGALLHYLEVRQSLAGIPQASLFDEIDHLGAYISQNRVDWFVLNAAKEKDLNAVYFDGFDEDVLGPYFMSPDWPDAEVPGHTYLPEIQSILELVDKTRQPGWLKVDRFFRDLSMNGQSDFIENFQRTAQKLNAKPFTWAFLKGETPTLCWLARHDGNDYEALSIRIAEIIALALDMSEIPIIELLMAPGGKVVTAASRHVRKPSILRADITELAAEAENMRAHLRQQ